MKDDLKNEVAEELQDSLEVDAQAGEIDNIYDEVFNEENFVEEPVQNVPVDKRFDIDDVLAGLDLMDASERAEKQAQTIMEQLVDLAPAEIAELDMRIVNLKERLSMQIQDEFFGDAEETNRQLKQAVADRQVAWSKWTEAEIARIRAQEAEADRELYDELAQKRAEVLSKAAAIDAERELAELEIRAREEELARKVELERIETENRAKIIEEEEKRAASERERQEALSKSKKKSIFSRLFSRNKDKTSVTFEDAPNATQAIINYEQMYDDGICKLADRTYSVAIAFDDTNYSSARDDDQLKIYDSYVSWLNTLDETVSAQLWFSSIRLSASDVGSQIAFEDVAGDEVGNRYRHEFNELFKSKTASKSKTMRKQRVLILTVEAATHEDASRILDTPIEMAHNFFTSVDVHDRVLSGQERLDLVSIMTNQDYPDGVASFAAARLSPNLSTRDLVAPSIIRRERGSDLFVGQRYVRTFFINGWSRMSRDDLLPALLSLSCDSVVSIHTRAWNQEHAIRFMDSKVFDITVEHQQWHERRTDVLRGRFSDSENLPSNMRKELEDAERIYEEVSQNDQGYFDITFTVTLFARSELELAQACSELISVFSRFSMHAEGEYQESRMQLFSTALPLGNPSHVKSCANFVGFKPQFSRTLLTENLANFVPFTAVNVIDDGGLYMGINADTRDFIIYNPDAHDAPNTLSFGMTRSGKSMNNKLIEVIQAHLRYPEDDIVIIDPEREYLQVVRDLGGEVVDISDGSSDHINLFDLSEGYSSDDSEHITSPLPLKISFIKSVISMMVKNVSDEENALIDEACASIYRKYLETYDEEDIPTLTTLYEYLLGAEGSVEAEAKHLAKLLREYVTGTISLYNHKTNVDINAPLVVFDVQSLSSQQKPLAIMVILDHVWNRITKNRMEGRRTRVIVDELQLLFDDEGAVDYFDKLFARAGKWGALIHGLTQNVTRFLEIPKMRYMLENTAILKLYKQSNFASARVLAEALSLSETQSRALENPQAGEGLYIFDSNKIIKFDNRVSKQVCPTLYSTTTTRFTDIAAMRREKSEE